jgi:hypothetical protein
MKSKEMRWYQKGRKTIVAPTESQTLEINGIRSRCRNDTLFPSMSRFQSYHNGQQYQYCCHTSPKVVDYCTQTDSSTCTSNVVTRHLAKGSTPVLTAGEALPGTGIYIETRGFHIYEQPPNFTSLISTVP